MKYLKMLWLISIFICVPCVEMTIYFHAEFCPATATILVKETNLMTECLLLCRETPGCKLFDRYGTKCILYPQPTNDQCQEGVQLTRYFVEQGDCHNGGILSIDMSCKCVHGYTGPKCEHRMTSCSEGYRSGSYNGYDGVLPVQPSSSKPSFFVRCDMVSGGRLYIQHHALASTDFYRPWEEYAEGFGKLMGDHWLGNRRLHDLVSAKTMTLTFQYTIYNGTTFSRSYDGFKIGGEDGKFAIESFTGTHGNLGSDCLSGLVGKMFSASDDDNDDLSWWSCAFEHGASFWFDRCDVPAYMSYGSPALCNPNGDIMPSANGIKLENQKEIFWLDFPFSVHETSIWLTD